MLQYHRIFQNNKKEKNNIREFIFTKKEKHEYNKIYLIFYIFERDFIPYTKEKIKSKFE